MQASNSQIKQGLYVFFFINDGPGLLATKTLQPFFKSFPPFFSTTKKTIKQIDGGQTDERLNLISWTTLSKITHKSDFYRKLQDLEKRKISLYKKVKNSHLRHASFLYKKLQISQHSKSKDFSFSHYQYMTN